MASPGHALLHAPLPPLVSQLSGDRPTHPCLDSRSSVRPQGRQVDKPWQCSLWKRPRQASWYRVQSLPQRLGRFWTLHASSAGEACSADDASSTSSGEEGVWSVIIPTYNRLPILQKCLQALEHQVGEAAAGVRKYEVVVVDDGSSDGTVEYLEAHLEDYQHVRLICQEHGGATKARNLGVRECFGQTIVFIDSDMVVAPGFLAAHAKKLTEAHRQDGNERAFTYGRVVNTSNFDTPQSEPFKLTDYSAAFFATGNVAISKRMLLKAAALLGPTAAGPFDADFSEYGWEDLELGERLRQIGARIVQCPEAVGYHWHPAFTIDQLPQLIEQERQRGRNGVRFYRKHPNMNVRLMIQMTPFHGALWFLLTFGGLLNERTLAPLLKFLVDAGKPGLAAGLTSPVLNWYTVQAVKEEVKRTRTRQ